MVMLFTESIALDYILKTLIVHVGVKSGVGFSLRGVGLMLGQARSIGWTGI
jgi:hypothetical protein